MFDLSPLPFRYLRWRRILAFMTVLVLSSILSSITALSLISFYKGVSAYMGEEKGITVLYDTKSRTPFTGLIPAFLADKAIMMKEVSACSPEVITPCIVKGKPVFLRGVLLEEFLKISAISIIDGQMLNAGDINSVIIGRRASERIGVEAGDKILVIGVLSPVCFELRVKGIFKSDGPLEDEIIAPLHIGQWLRGTGYNYVTIIRVKGGCINFQETILKPIAEETAKPDRPEKRDSSGGKLSEHVAAQWTAIRFRAEDIGIRETEEFMRDYMERYGVTRESILILSIATIIFSGATILLAAETLISQHSDEIGVLRSIGASRKLLKRDIIFKLFPVFLTATVLGITAAIALLDIVLERGMLQVLFHNIQLQVDVFALILIASAILAVIIVGVWRSIR